MNEKELIDDIFKNVPEDVARTMLSFMDIGTVLYLCETNDLLNNICTESFWKKKVDKTYMRQSKTGWATWRNMALALYLQSLEQCFECSQYDSTDRIRQCEDCGVDLCTLCGDSKLNLCMDCKEADDEVF